MEGWRLALDNVVDGVEISNHGVQELVELYPEELLDLCEQRWILERILMACKALERGEGPCV